MVKAMFLFVDAIFDLKLVRSAQESTFEKPEVWGQKIPSNA